MCPLYTDVWCRHQARWWRDDAPSFVGLGCRRYGVLCAKMRNRRDYLTTNMPEHGLGSHEHLLLRTRPLDLACFLLYPSAAGVWGNYDRFDHKAQGSLVVQNRLQLQCHSWCNCGMVHVTGIPRGLGNPCQPVSTRYHRCLGQAQAVKALSKPHSSADRVWERLMEINIKNEVD